MEDIEILLKKSRRIVFDIEEIIRWHYGWIDLIDERLIAHAAYDNLLECMGTQCKAGDQVNNSAGRIPVVWLLWPIAKLIYHIFVSRVHNLFKKHNLSAISDAILILPGVISLPNLLSRLEENLKAHYFCVSMTATSDNIPWEIKQLSDTTFPPHIEGFLSFRDVLWFMRIMTRVATGRSEFVKDIRARVFSKYNINNPAVIKKIINTIFYSIFDNIEYCLIGKKIVKNCPRALISEIANYGKIAYVMSYVGKKNIMTIGLQHGVIIDPFEYLPASEYFGCPSTYALKRLKDLECPVERKTHYFLSGLPEQMTSKVIFTDHRRATALVDSNERIRMYKRQSIEILQKSKKINELPVLYIKSHPRASNAMKIENLFTLPNYRSMGISDWDDFSRRINVAITFSFDAVYELLIRKIVTIVINPSKRFYPGDYTILNNLKFVCSSEELDSILSDILDEKIIWNKSEEQEITDYLSYVFGKYDNSLYRNAVKEIIDSASQQ